jgi:hypothetical protein
MEVQAPREASSIAPTRFWICHHAIKGRNCCMKRRLCPPILDWLRISIIHWSSTGCCIQQTWTCRRCEGSDGSNACLYAKASIALIIWYCLYRKSFSLGTKCSKIENMGCDTLTYDYSGKGRPIVRSLSHQSMQYSFRLGSSRKTVLWSSEAYNKDTQPHQSPHHARGTIHVLTRQKRRKNKQGQILSIAARTIGKSIHIVSISVGAAIVLY